MKRIAVLMAAAALAGYAAPVSAQGGGGENSINPKVFWDGGRIPDPAFRAYVLDKFDTDRDGTISRAEAEAVTEINIAKVSSVDGIEKFTQLKLLGCINSELVSLDLSKNSA